jgi:hypothetical protein
LNTTPEIFLIHFTRRNRCKRNLAKMPLSADEVGRRKMDMDEGFGVLKHNHKDRLNTEPKGGRKPWLRDHERGVPPGIKYHPQRMTMQAAPDHGDHE